MEILELLFIFAILIIVFGPTKLPKVARDIGKAVYEFKKSSSGLIGTVDPSLPVGNENVETTNAITDIAEKLNIDTKGKNIKQITQEILTRIN